MKKLLFFFALLQTSLLLINFVNAETCQISSKDDGVCKSIYECLPVLSSWKMNGTRPTYCYEEYDNVCCPKQERHMRVSERKCLEYLKYVFEQVKTLPEDPEDDYVTTYVDRCGINTQQYAIVGGEDAGVREYPHMVAIGDNGIEMEDVPDYVQWFCGGSLISERFVLTAAHCVVTNKVIHGNTITPRVVKLGALNLDIDEPSVKIYEVEQGIAYPEYVNQYVYHDIGLLKLKKNVELTINIRPICLSTDTSKTHDNIWAIGWGDYKGAGYEGVLQKLKLPLVSHPVCNGTYVKARKRLPNGLNQRILCYGAVKGIDTCPGASGGPIQVINREVYCSFSLVGITSAGVRCTEGYPGLFTKVSEYIDWIESKVWSADA